MDQKTRKIVIAGSLLTLGSIGAYFGYQAWKKWKDEKDLKDANLAAALANVGSGGGGGGGSTPYTPPVQTNTNRPDDVLAFQQYVINVKGNKTILGKGGPSGFGDDGAWGGNTAKAWTKYKTDYLAASGGATTTNPKGLTIKTIDTILKPIAKSLGSKTIYFGTNPSDVNYVKYTSPTTGNQYYWFGSGAFKVWKSPQNLSWGSFMNKGKKVVVGGGVNKGETMTGNDALATAYKSTIDTEPLMTNASAKLIATNLKTAMAGAGTYDDILWNNLYEIKNGKQWKQVFNKFGSPSSANLDNWLNQDLEYTSERKKFNTYAKGRNIPLRLQEIDRPAGKITTPTT